jgi:hypothetical protein
MEATTSVAVTLRLRGDLGQDQRQTLLVSAFLFYFLSLAARVLVMYNFCFPPPPSNFGHATAHVCLVRTILFYFFIFLKFLRYQPQILSRI